MSKRREAKIPVSCPQPLVFGESENPILSLQRLGDETKLRVCCRCKQAKRVCDFNKRKGGPGGLSNWCRDCERLGKLLRKARNKIYVKEKRCCRCGEVRPRDAFNLDRYATNGLASACRDCSRAAARKRACELNRQKLNLPDTKKCGRCGQVKSYTEFYIQRDKRDGLMSHCKQCVLLGQRVKYAVGQADKIENRRGPDLENWDQVESAIREMTELQVLIDKQEAQCDAAIERVKADTAALARPHVMHQARLDILIERFIKRTRRTCGKIEKHFVFGSVYFVQNRLDLRLNTGLAKRRMGLP